jgi:hypothetical protein
MPPMIASHLVRTMLCIWPRIIGSAAASTTSGAGTNATAPSLSGEDCLEIDGTTRLVESVPKFTSRIWPVAAGMLGTALGKSMSYEANIIVDEQSKQSLAINQTVGLVLRFSRPQDDEDVDAK